MPELALVKTIADDTTPKTEPEPSVHVRITDKGAWHRPLIDRSRTACDKPIVGYYAMREESYDDLCTDGCFTPLELMICARRYTERQAEIEAQEREAERDSQERLQKLQDERERDKLRVETATARMRRLERAEIESTDTATDPTRARTKAIEDDDEAPIIDEDDDA